MSELFTVKRFESSDLPIINLWWNKRGHPGVPESAFPETSLCVQKENILCAFGSAYHTNSDVIYLDNVITSPFVEPYVSGQALEILISALMSQAKDLGYKYWNANSKLKSVFELGKKFNLTQSDTNHYWFTGVL